MLPAVAGDPLLAVYAITRSTNAPTNLVKCDLSALSCDATLTLLANEVGWAESAETDPGAAFINRVNGIAYIATTVPGNNGYLVFVSFAVDFAGGISAPMTRLRSTTLSTSSGIAVCGAQHPTLPIGYFVTRNEDVWTITFPDAAKDGSIKFTLRECKLSDEFHAMGCGKAARQPGIGRCAVPSRSAAASCGVGFLTPRARVGPSRARLARAAAAKQYCSQPLLTDRTSPSLATLALHIRCRLQWRRRHDVRLLLAACPAR